MIVEIEALTKVFEQKQKQRVVAIDGITFSVEEGEIFGLLGPNGAGKTTTIGICTTRTQPTSGTVRIHGIDVRKSPAAARRHIGVVPQYNTLDRSLTLYENLYFHCRYFGQSHASSKARSEELLAQFHLSERRDAYPGQLSGGLAQRIQIARAIAHHPKVLFLDEPSAGLDPQSRLAMWEAVSALGKAGLTVVLTTHYMEEADELSHRVAVVDHGRVLALDTPEKLKAAHGADTVVDVKLRSIAELDAVVTRVGALAGVTQVESTAEGLRVFVPGAEAGGLLAGILGAVNEHGVRDVKISEPSLETVFIRLTGRELRD